MNETRILINILYRAFVMIVKAMESELGCGKKARE
jgi:hypothetical protein